MTAHRILLVLLLIPLLHGCAATPPPAELGSASLEEAEQALASAAAADDVKRYAPVELQKARDVYNRANQAWLDEDKALAEHLAYMARRHAEIAMALADEAAAATEAEQLEARREELRLEARGRELTAQQREIEQLRSQLAELNPRQSDRGIVLTISSVLFAFDSADLTSAADPPLDKLASFLRDHPDRQVRIEGHTDSIGSETYNQQLSLQRAQSVADAMTRRGIASWRMTVVGYGESRPVATNSTEAGRQQNRRVEFVILD